MKSFFHRVILFVITFLFGIGLTGGYAQTLYFPPNTGNTWETVSPASLGWNTGQIDSLYDFLSVNNTKAFIVLKDGKIVLEQYFGTFTQDSLWYWASAGKTMTAFLVGMAQQEGFLSITDTTSHYLGTGWTSCAPETEEKITIRHQLTMTTGLNDVVADPDCTLPSCLTCIANAGTRWAYHNAPYTLLDGVIENATGTTLNQYFINKVRNPTGMNGFYVKLGYNNVLFSKARSMARFGLLLLNNGNWNGNQIMTDAGYLEQMVNTSQELNLSYGYLTWLNGKTSFMLPTVQFVFPGCSTPHAPASMYSALGKNGQVLNVVPGNNLVVVRMGDAPDAGAVPVVFVDQMWQKLTAIIPELQLAITGSATVCTNGVAAYSVPAVPNAVYTWTVTGGVITSGQGTPQITVQWNTGVTSGTVNVEQTLP
ncbi:serine hydrolase [Sphingobacteriales bacterium UPWRP_1]|nr:serine hydrolase [Sphingobacteriales bacterium UPWRP_1]